MVGLTSFSDPENETLWCLLCLNRLVARLRLEIGISRAGTQVDKGGRL